MSALQPPLPRELPLSEMSNRLCRTAKEAFGWSELRPGQLAAMEAVMAGRDTVAVVLFGDVGYRTLSLATVQARSLLTAADPA